MTGTVGQKTAPVLALCGGVGGAKLALGLYHALGPDQLTVVVNTGDDFEHLGLHISPDLDTVLYTLAGCSNPETGWGRAKETWNFMSMLTALGGEAWFRLGDGDLALHVERTHRLRLGQTLTGVADAFRKRLGIRARILPMSNDSVRTIVHTPDAPLTFQHYFVREGSRPVVTGITFEGAERAEPNPLVLELLSDPQLRSVVICPSNPYLSIDPILALPKLREALKACAAPVLAVSPVVQGHAIKGPTAKIMRELGVPTTNTAISRHYEKLIDGLVLDTGDIAEAEAIQLPTIVCDTVMTTLEDRIELARTVLDLASQLDKRGHTPTSIFAGKGG